MVPNPTSIEELYQELLQIDQIHDGLFPKTRALATKMINTEQQLHYQTTTRTNNCIPLGIAKQCKFTFSGNDCELQKSIQHMFYDAGSRAFDLIIDHTKNNTESLKRRYYSQLEELKSACHNSDLDFSTYHNKIQSSMRAMKTTTSATHAKKLYRDQQHFRLYRKPEDSRHPVHTNNRKPNRRFKRPIKKKPPRRPAFRRRRQKLKSTGIPTSINVDKFHYNLTNFELTDNHKMIFCLGQKFCPTPIGANWSEFETSIDNWSYLLRYAVYYHGKPNDSCPSYERLLVKRETRKPINSSGRPALELYIQKVKDELLVDQRSKYVASNITPEQQTALREMKFWDRDHNIIIRPYDKGQGFFIDHKDAYKARVLKDLDSDLYVHVSDKATMFAEVVDAINTWNCNWQDVSLLTPVLREWITPDATRKPGNIYMNYKRHKPDSNFPGRLITSGVGSLTENLSSLVALELKPLAEQLPHVLIDTNSLLRRLDEISDSGIIRNDMDIIHVSWDVVAMFPNVPESLGMSKCREMLDKREEGKGLPTECVLEALKICLNYNISQFDDQWYRQVRGAAMGPHEACFYCDIAMSHFDELVFSELNPCMKPLVWLRYRDDIYDPWPHGEAELLKFTDWLNSLSETIKFTVSYSIGQGVEYLDTCIYLRDGRLQTSLYSKSSDTHAYLPPSSCHPYHICKNNPEQVARRVRKLSSEGPSYAAAREKFSGLLVERGYSVETVNESFIKFDDVDRKTLYNPSDSNKVTGRKRCFPLVSEYNPHLPAVPPVLHKYKYLLELDPVVSAAIPPDSIFASYKQPKSIKAMLVHSKFRSSENTPIVSNSKFGCKSCNNCFLCKFYLIETDTFKSYHCDSEFKINQELTCNSEGIIYLILDFVCRRCYVGSTVDNMKTRMSNYKNHLKIKHKGCEMAQHFAEVQADTHSLLVDDTVNMRSKDFQNRFDTHLSNQIKVIIIDCMDLSSADTTKAKRALLEVREGFWQTQLRTLTRYGGLNKKDERKISNKRLANKFKVTVSSSSQPNPQASLPQASLPQASLSQASLPQASLPQASLPQALPNPVVPLPVSRDPPHPTPTPDSSASSSPPLRRSSRLRNVKKPCNFCT